MLRLRRCQITGSFNRFDLARAEGRSIGFYNGTTKRGDYNTTAESWREQRTFIIDAPKLLEQEHPAFAASLATALEDLRDVKLPPTGQLHPVADPTALHQCGGLQVGFDARGALSTLVGGGGGGTVWANASHPVGLFEYQSFDNEDYNVFLADFTARVNGSSYRACPAHYRPGTPDDMGCKNFRKPNVTSAAPVHRVLHPTLTKLWAAAEDAAPREVGGAAAVACAFVAELAMDKEAHLLAGAPERLVVAVNVSSSGAYVRSWFSP